MMNSKTTLREQGRDEILALTQVSVVPTLEKGPWRWDYSIGQFMPMVEAWLLPSPHWDNKVPSSPRELV